MDFRFLIARRYLASRKQVTLISVITGISIAGVSLGVAALIVVLSVMNGFYDIVRDLLVSLDPHVRIVSAEGRGIAQADTLGTDAAALPQVEARGLTDVERSQVELMESYAASPWRITREVRIPNAMPYFFTALKLASSLAVIAAIVAEYFGGRQDALGPLITQSAGLTRYGDAWAAVLAGTVIGTVLYVTAVVLERLAMPWHASIRHQPDR